jgi:hypothetical protein
MVVGRYGDTVTSTWTVVPDERRRPVLRLTLTDLPDSVAAQFATEELEDGERLWSRLNRLWADLLQKRSHRLIEGLQQSLQGQEGP